MCAQIPPRPPRANVHVRPTRADDCQRIYEIAKRVYPHDLPWTSRELSVHLRLFPEGQLVAIDRDRDDLVVGSASSLIVSWEDYDFDTSWHDFTDRGMFTNHDPTGKTLYGADVQVDPAYQGRGVGGAMYVARREMVRRLNLRRIRAGARLRHYNRVADQMSPERYVEQVVAGEIRDPTLSFQLRQGFRVLKVVRDYLDRDPASHGHAAVIEWLNPDYRDEP